MVSNTVVSRLAFHMALPAAMLVMLFYTLKAAEREQRTWIAQRESAHQKAVTSNDIESIPFVLPFQHSARIQDAVGLQWPAFVLAGIIAPVPQLFYSEGNPLRSPGPAMPYWQSRWASIGLRLVFGSTKGSFNGIGRPTPESSELFWALPSS